MMECNVCHRDKPDDAFAVTGFAYPGRARKRRKTCRDCLNTAKRGKVCPGCQRYRARKHFYADASRASGLSNYCKACKDAKVADWRTQHPALYAAYQARYRRTQTKRKRLMAVMDKRAA